MCVGVAIGRRLIKDAMRNLSRECRDNCTSLCTPQARHSRNGPAACTCSRQGPPRFGLFVGHLCQGVDLALPQRRHELPRGKLAPSTYFSSTIGLRFLEEIQALHTQLLHVCVLRRSNRPADHVQDRLALGPSPLTLSQYAAPCEIASGTVICPVVGMSDRCGKRRPKSGL